MRKRLLALAVLGIILTFFIACSGGQNGSSYMPDMGGMSDSLPQPPPQQSDDSDQSTPTPSPSPSPRCTEVPVPSPVPSGEYYLECWGLNSTSPDDGDPTDGPTPSPTASASATP